MAVNIDELHVQTQPPPAAAPPAAPAVAAVRQKPKLDLKSEMETLRGTREPIAGGLEYG